jgi:hypothetical protein
MRKPIEKGEKRPYSTPVLTVYGTVRELTQTVGIFHNRDGGNFPRSNTAARFR